VRDPALFFKKWKSNRQCQQNWGKTKKREGVLYAAMKSPKTSSEGFDMDSDATEDSESPRNIPKNLVQRHSLARRLTLEIIDRELIRQGSHEELKTADPPKSEREQRFFFFFFPFFCPFFYSTLPATRPILRTSRCAKC
jgi:hypothetical protein